MNVQSSSRDPLGHKTPRISTRESRDLVMTYRESTAREANGFRFEGNTASLARSESDPVRRDRLAALEELGKMKATPESLYVMAVGWAELGDWAKSVESIERIPKGDAPAKAVKLLATALAKLGEHTRSIEAATAALSLDPLDPEPYSVRAGERMALKDYIAAAVDLNKHLQVEPNPGAAVFAQLSICYMETDQFLLTEKACTQALALAHDPAVLFRRGLARERLGDGAGASADFAQVLAGSPSFVAGHRERAMELIRAGRYKSALGLLESLLRIDPMDTVLETYAAYCALRSGQMQDAQAILDALVLTPGEHGSTALFLRAQTRALAGEHLSAVEDYGATLAVSPGNIAALKGRIKCLYALGGAFKRQLLSDLGTWVQLRPAEAEAHFRLAAQLARDSPRDLGRIEKSLVDGWKTVVLARMSAQSRERSAQRLRTAARGGSHPGARGAEHGPAEPAPTGEPGTDAEGGIALDLPEAYGGLGVSLDECRAVAWYTLKSKLAQRLVQEAEVIAAPSRPPSGPLNSARPKSPKDAGRQKEAARPKSPRDRAVAAPASNRGKKGEVVERPAAPVPRLAWLCLSVLEAELKNQDLAVSTGEAAAELMSRLTMKREDDLMVLINGSWRAESAVLQKGAKKK